MITITETLLHKNDVPKIGHVTTMTNYATKEQRQAQVVAVKILTQGKDRYNHSTGCREQRIKAEVSYKFI
jgi:hypothetical protein